MINASTTAAGGPPGLAADHTPIKPGGHDDVV